MSSQASYKGRRMLLPRLANTYVVIQESHQYGFPNGVSTLNIPFASSASMNELHSFEPAIFPKSFFDNSPLAAAMFDRYKQFRIRKIAVRLTEVMINSTNSARSDIWCYWCPNHAAFDAAVAAGSSFVTVDDISESSRFQHMGRANGRSVTLEVVPQVIYQSQMTVGGVSTDISSDGKMPWMDCKASNKDSTLMRMPVFYFRKPVSGVGVPYAPQFQVLLVAVIEFRNLDDDN